MELSLEYLKSRHSFWIYKIGDAGIWNPLQFTPVDIVIRKNSRNYNGLFQRRVKIIKGKKIISDKIVIYNKVIDFDTKFLDSVLVHEMIHQYIFQSGLKDLRTHGPLFREFMHKINVAFPEELKINITDTNPSIPKSGAGSTRHVLLILELADGNCYCNVIMPSRTEFFEQMVKDNLKFWKIKNHYWAESNDVYFNHFRRCSRSLHGIKKSFTEMKDFMQKYNVRINY